MNGIWHDSPDSVRIVVDEVGLASGTFGALKLKTAYQLIFRRLDGNQIEPFAVHGRLVPHLQGRAVAADASSFADGNGTLLATLSRGLALRNLEHLPTDRLALLLDFDPGGGDVQTLIQGVSQCEVAAASVFCCIPTSSLLDRRELAERALTLRDAGLGAAVGGFGLGSWDVACLEAVRPDIVRVDQNWFHVIVAHPAAVRLLAALIATIHDSGTEVLIDGINKADHLRVALECGADLLQGDILARPALAGSMFDMGRRSLDWLNSSQVIPLFA